MPATATFDRDPPQAGPANVDVAIVGAGPAGASTALHLLGARPGTRIALIDRARLPRVKPCGGAISRWGLEVLETLGATPAALGIDAVPIHTLRVRRAGFVGEHTTPASAPPLGAVVWRATFDEALAREAARRGATLLDGARVTALESSLHDHKLTMQMPTGESRVIVARFVVGADGSGSAVRRLSSMTERGPRARLIVVETESAPGDDVLREGRGVLEFDLDVLDTGIDGYVWHFATTVDGRAAVSRGVYDWRGRRALDAQRLRAELERILRARGLPVTGLKPYTERVFVDGTSPLALRSGVLLVGEAAGLVDPVTGEGIAQALASGRIAAEEVVRAFGSAVDPERYRAAMAAVRFHRHLRQTSALAKLVYGRFGAVWAEALARTDSAMSASADWYSGTQLGTARKARVGVALAASLSRAGVRRARG